MKDVIVDIGQLTDADKKHLNKLVKNGLIQKGKGGPFLMIKTVYAPLWYDIEGQRKVDIKYLISLS